MRKDKLARSETKRMEQKRKMEENASFFYDAAEGYCNCSIDPLTEDARTFYFEEQCYVMLFSWAIELDSLNSISWHEKRSYNRRSGE